MSILNDCGPRDELKLWQYERLELWGIFNLISFVFSVQSCGIVFSQ